MEEAIRLAAMKYGPLPGQPLRKRNYRPGAGAPTPRPGLLLGAATFNPRTFLGPRKIRTRGNMLMICRRWRCSNCIFRDEISLLRFPPFRSAPSVDCTWHQRWHGNDLHQTCPTIRLVLNVSNWIWTDEMEVAGCADVTGMGCGRELLISPPAADEHCRLNLNANVWFGPRFTPRRLQRLRFVDSWLPLWGVLNLSIGPKYELNCQSTCLIVKYLLRKKIF